MILAKRYEKPIHRMRKKHRVGLGLNHRSVDSIVPQMIKINQITQGAVEEKAYQLLEQLCFLRFLRSPVKSEAICLSQPSCLKKMATKLNPRLILSVSPCTLEEIILNNFCSFNYIQSR
jgi:hypothetical protein